MKKFFQHKIVKRIYQIFISFLAIISVLITFAHWRHAITLSKEPFLFFLDVSIYLIFSVDYVVRLLLSSDKAKFIESNIPDLISLIPYYSVFKLFRIFKIRPLAKFSRKLKFNKIIFNSLILIAKIKKFLKMNGLIYLLVFSGIAITVSAVIISYTEKISYSNGLWWAFVTATTVGYGDISPQTHVGRFIAALLILIGIGTIGMITGTIATYFLNKRNDIIPNDHLDEYIMNSEYYSDSEKKEIINFIQFVRSKRNIKKHNKKT